MAEVQLKQVSKNFGGTVAVDNLSLQISDGELVVLLGPTGAGKTTTLRLVAGLEKPELGQLKIGGLDVTQAAPAERDVCFIFQQYSLYPHYSVFDNMAFPLRAPGRDLSEPEIKSRVQEIAEMLRIDSKLKNKATELSGGEMQRVAIGRALVRSPSIYLMDEPLSSLDAKMRDELRVELKRIQRELDATILYVTHDQLEAMTMADRIGVLREGRLVQIDSPRKVYEEPVNRYVAKRLGSPQINLFSPTLFSLDNLPDGTAQIGVRPEDILLSTDNGLNAKVLTVEHLGAETVALLLADDQQIRCLLGPNDDIKEGESVSVAIRPTGIVYFDIVGDRLKLHRNDW